MLIKKYYLTIFIFLLPYLLFHWMFPFFTELCPGREFVRYFTWWQTEFLFAMRTGTFPLVMNMTSGGLNSVMAAGYGQIYLPYPYIAAIFPSYWTGQALEWNIILHFLTIAITHLALFSFLRQIDLNRPLAFFLSTVTLYSTGILLPLFYGVALDAWTGHLFLCAAAGLFFLNPSKIKGPLLIILATYWLACSGHTEVMYYGLLGAGIFILLLPSFLATILPDKHITLKMTLSFWLHTGIYCSTGIALAAAYILPFYFEITKNILLAHQSYAAVSGLADTYLGCISNFFSPLRTSVMSSFGGNPLLPALLLIPALKLLRIRIPVVIWVTTGIIIFVLLGTLGDQTPVHLLIWKHLPFASATRLPGRIAIILPVLFMLLSAWILSRHKAPPNFKHLKISPLTVLAVVSIFFYFIYIIFIIAHPLKNQLFPFSLINITSIPIWVEPLTIIISMTLLLLTALYTADLRRKKTGGVLCVLTILHIVLLFKFYPMPRMLIEDKDRPTFQQFLEQKQKKMAMRQEQYLFPFDAATTYEKATIPQLEKYFLEPALGKIYRHYIVARDRADAYKILNTVRQRDEIVIEDYLPEPGAPFLLSACDNTPDTVILTYNSYNKIIFSVDACTPGFFLFPYSRTDNWQAFLNGRKISTFRANGYAQAVRLPAGKHTIEFRYWSWAFFWGVILSCATLMLIGLVVGIRMSNTAGFFVTAATIISATGVFFFWYQSLYTGQNLGTVYTWESDPPETPRNLAYGKPTAMSSHYPDTPYRHNSRHAVDGDPSIFSCFVTGDQPYPWWEVDLRKPEEILTIILYTSLQGEEYDKMIAYFPDNHKTILHRGSFAITKKPVRFNRLPLTISISTDHEHWQTSHLDIIRKDTPFIIRLGKPLTARYIKITASGKCRLSLNEVEIYSTAIRKAGP